MFEIKKAETRAEFDEFFTFSQVCGYSEAESRYLRRYASPVLNPIRTDERAYLYAVSDGMTVGRLITWKDRVRDMATGENCGFFALCDALTDECKVLMERMLALQKRWGSSYVTGPVSPDGSGFFNGMALVPNASIMNTPYMPVNLPALYGFEMRNTEVSYMAEVPQRHFIRDAAKTAVERFGIRIKPVEKRIFSDELPACAADFAPHGMRTMAARQAERISGLVDRELSYEAFLPDGRRAGYVLTFRGTPPRVTTFMTGNGAFTPAVTCALLDALYASLLKKGIRFAEAGVIDDGNKASQLLVRSCNATELNKYRVYIQQIN